MCHNWLSAIIGVPASCACSKFQAKSTFSQKLPTAALTKQVLINSLSHSKNHIWSKLNRCFNFHQNGLRSFSYHAGKKTLLICNALAYIVCFFVTSHCPQNIHFVTNPPNSQK